VNTPADFEDLVPDTMLNAVECATGRRMTGLAHPLPSYINRVYEVEAEDGERLIAKFYRPGRWSREALQDEHDFVLACSEDEIPVIAPLVMDNGDTLHEDNGIYFTIFPKRFGRKFEANRDEDWVRIGSLMGRVHAVGAREDATARTDLHPAESTETHIDHLLDNGIVTPQHEHEFEAVTDSIMDLILDIFDDAEFMRIHGDCHGGNILDRPGEGIMIIDFDDMMVGPPVQDLWMLLPDAADNCRREFNLILSGYEQFREFDDNTFRLIEPLRAMRIIYFLAWCSRQVNDYRFRTLYPDWGSDSFWQQEIADLTRQRDLIRSHLQ
jgi:Ser/Thr protein kinase RdoA (MazF antagonist)